MVDRLALLRGINVGGRNLVNMAELRAGFADLGAADVVQAVVDAAPDGFGAAEDRCDVIFVRRPLTAAHAFSLFDPREGVDRVWKGNDVVYHARSAARASRSRLKNVMSLPEYKNMTIRSWSTTAKLAELMATRARNRR